MSHHLNMTMGVSLCGVGCYAYYTKGSKASLIASCTFGAAYFASAALIQSNTNPQLGHDIATVASGLLTVTMGKRVLKNKTMDMFAAMAMGGVAVGGYNLRKSIEYREPAEIDIDEQDLAKSLGLSTSTAS